jgi:hypothetical protein
MKPFTTFLLLVFFVSLTTTAQITEKNYKFAFQFDNRFSSIRSNDITILGGKVGFQYKKMFRLGLGVSFITSPVNITYLDKKTNALSDNKISFWYGSIFNDWIFYKNQKWECFVTEQIGYGKPSFVKTVNDEIVNDISIPLYVNEISGQVNYKIFHWLGAGAGIGYRNIWNKQAALRSTFDAPIYIAKIILYPETMLKKN